MNFPPRVILALVVIGAIAAIGAWGLVTVLRARNMTELQRMMAVGGIVILMVVLAAWVIFLWPAYWTSGTAGALIPYGGAGNFE